MKKLLKQALLRLTAWSPLLQKLLKERDEITYWKKRHHVEGTLANDHYEHFYTDYFALSLDDYADKHVLDIGCGPRGSLEWCVTAASVTGADPLADEYLKLGADKHRMTYVSTGAEDMPFGDGQFDIVTCFNALDHVENIEATLDEMHRCLAPGGELLLIVEVDHAPTLAEPHSIAPAWLLSWMASRFDIISERRSGIRDDHNIYRSLSETPYRDGEAGVMSIRAVKHL